MLNEIEKELITIIAKRCTKPVLVNELKAENYLVKILEYLKIKANGTDRTFILLECIANNYSGWINILYQTDLFYLPRIKEVLWFNKLHTDVLDDLFVWPIDENRVKVEFTLRLQKHK